MTRPIPATSRLVGRFAQLRAGRDVIRQEAEALARLARRLDESFCAALDLLQSCRGNVLVCGMGKAGLIGQKIAATLASTGARAFFLHPAEAVHGDLGRAREGDLVLILSQSGETAEVVQVLPALRAVNIPVIAVTCRAASAVARQADVTICLGAIEEACPLGLAPTTSTAAMLAVGDALALVLSQMRGFSREDFARNHPGGSLGRRLMRVEEAMRPASECRVAGDEQIARDVFVEQSRPGRRSGAIMLVDSAGKLTGIFTDSDLARVFEKKREAELDGPIGRLMTRGPATIAAGAMLPDAVKLMAAKKISELPVIDDQGRPIGMLDVTDVVTLLPDERTPEWAPEEFAQSAPPADAADELHPPTVPFSNRDAAGGPYMKKDDARFTDRARGVRLLLSDVDGVLNDGRLIFDERGGELKQFHIRDGLGVKLWQRAGHQFGIVTGRNSPVVERRAAELGITIVRQGAEDKLAAVKDLLERLKVPPAETAYLGDDLPDLPAIEYVGLGVAVADGCEAVRQHAHYVTKSNGGAGAARELIEKILTAQDRWNDVLASFRL